ncbi:hypothetical protein HS125_17815 [bacterium]|nr:hypothetical protein [bacterium]
MQRRCIALAKQGYIGLSVKSTHPESLPWGISPLTGMTWNNLRALDYLCSRPDVNQARLGCTGASGGGQQTHFLMCIDDRLDAAVPAVYSSYMKEIMTGRTWVHCNCNWIPGLLAVTDEPEMAAAFAPRPLLFISNQQDWTARWETEGLPDVRKVYGWHGAEGAVENAQYSEPHGYPKPWRERMYAFFNQHFMGGGLASVVEPDSLPELSPREMAAMLPEVPTCQERVDRLEAEFAARLGKRLAEPRDRADAARLQHNLLEHLRRFLHEPAPTRRASPPATVHEDVSGDCRLRVVHVSTEPEITVPALLITALGGASARSLVILVDGRGKEVVFAEEEKLWRGLLAAGAGILIPDVRYWGELSTHPAWPRAYGTLVGRPPAAVAAHDVLELARSLRTTGEFDRRRIVVMGIGDGAVPALLAGALDEELEGVAGTDVGPTYTEGRTTPVCTGILQVCDLPDLACLLAPRPLFWAGVPDTAAYASADRFAKVVRARGHLITSERENAERPGLLAWYSTLRERR